MSGLCRRRRVPDPFSSPPGCSPGGRRRRGEAPPDPKTVRPGLPAVPPTEPSRSATLLGSVRKANRRASASRAARVRRWRCFWVRRHQHQHDASPDPLPTGRGPSRPEDRAFRQTYLPAALSRAHSLHWGRPPSPAHQYAGSMRLPSSQWSLLWNNGGAPGLSVWNGSDLGNCDGPPSCLSPLGHRTTCGPEPWG